MIKSDETKRDLLKIISAISYIQSNAENVANKFNGSIKNTQNNDPYLLQEAVSDTYVGYQKLLNTTAKINSLVSDGYIDPTYQNLYDECRELYEKTEELWEIYSQKPVKERSVLINDLIEIIKDGNVILDEVDIILSELLVIERSLEQIEQQDITVLKWYDPAVKLTLLVPDTDYGVMELNGVQIGAFLVHDDGSLTHIVTGGKVSEFNSDVIAAYVARKLTQIVPDGDITALRANYRNVGQYVITAHDLLKSRRIVTSGVNIGREK